MGFQPMSSRARPILSLPNGCPCHERKPIAGALSNLPVNNLITTCVRPASAICLVVLSALILVLGFYPSPLIALAQRSAQMWFGGH